MLKLSILKNLFVFFAFTTTLSSLARDIFLFTAPHTPSPTYDPDVRSLKEEDVLIFSDGKRFTFKKNLGNGAATFVVETKEGMALRIPKHATVVSSMNSYWKAYQDMQGLRLPMVVAVETESQPPEYILVKKVDVKHTLNDWLKAKKIFSPKEEKAMKDDLIRLGKKMWPLSRIGDFHAKQLAWTGKNWVLLDFSGGATFIKKVASANPFSSKIWNKKNEGYKKYFNGDETRVHYFSEIIKEIEKGIKRRRESFLELGGQFPDLRTKYKDAIEREKYFNQLLAAAQTQDLALKHDRKKAIRYCQEVLKKMN